MSSLGENGCLTFTENSHSPEELDKKNDSCEWENVTSIEIDHVWFPCLEEILKLCVNVECIQFNQIGHENLITALKSLANPGCLSWISIEQDGVDKDVLLPLIPRSSENCECFF